MFRGIQNRDLFCSGLGRIVFASVCSTKTANRTKFSVRYFSSLYYSLQKNFLRKMLVCKLRRSDGNISSGQMSSRTIRSFCVASLAFATDN